MRIKNAMQLKAHVNNIAKEAGIPTQCEEFLIMNHG